MNDASRRTAGFTLMEVLVALGIMSLVMLVLYTSLNASLEARDKLETESKVARLGPEILDQIEADLRRLWIWDIRDDAVFKGESRTINGESADTLSLLTTVDSTVTRRVGEREVSADVCETGYRLRRNPALPDVLELWRRQSFHVDEKPLDDGVYELLHDRVVSFQVRYYASVDRWAEELPSWDSGALHRLPALVSIELELEAVARTVASGAEGGRTLRYERIVPLMPGSDLAMRVRPLVPTFVALGSGGPGGPGGKGDGEGEEGEGEGSEADAGGGKDDGGSSNTPGGNGGSGGNSSTPPGGGNPDDFGNALNDLLNGLTGGGGG